MDRAPQSHDDAQSTYKPLLATGDEEELTEFPKPARSRQCSGESEQHRESSARTSRETRSSKLMRTSTWSLHVHANDTLPEYEIELDREDFETPDIDADGCYASFRQTVKHTLEGRKYGACAACIQSTIICCILFSTCCVIVETIEDVKREFRNSFTLLENVFTVVFTIEIVVRVWVAERPCEYFLTAANLVDILAVIPWYIEFVACSLIPAAQNKFDIEVSDSFQSLRMVRIVRMIRLSRVARLAKAARHSETITTMIQSVKGSASSLCALLACICMGTVFSATAIYWLECDDPETEFTSIPASIWWALPTITGVGYGDMVPMTVSGRIAASLAMVAGTLITSLCVAILTNSFYEQFQKNMKVLRYQQSQTNLMRVDKKKKMKLPQSPSYHSAEFAGVEHHRSFHHSDSGADIDEENLVVRLHAFEEEVERMMTHLRGRSQESKYQTSLDVLEDYGMMFFKQLSLAVEQVAEPDECGEAEVIIRRASQASLMLERRVSLSSILNSKSPSASIQIDRISQEHTRVEKSSMLDSKVSEERLQN